MSSDARVARPLAADAAEILQQLDRILASQEFARALRQQAFLRFVISEQIAGRGHEIKETLVALAVYEKAPDYDPRIDSTVRVEASKLRLRLQHYYEGAGSVDRLRISIPKGSYQPNIELAPADLAKPSTNWRMAFFLTAAVLTAVLAWRWRIEATRAPDPSRMKLTRLTESASFSAAPALSPKGDFTVYTSDRDNSGVLNLWRQDLQRQESDGGPPVRLTRSAFNHDTPAVSGDGTTLVFRTAEGGGMLAQMPVAGGEPQLVRDSSGGRNPRFARLGSSIVYWVPRDEQTVDYGRVFLDPLGLKHGPGPVRLFGDFAHAAFPIWSEAGTHVLVLGTWHSDVPEKEFDAWVVELKGLHSQGSPKKTGLFPALQAAGLYVGTAGRSRVEIADWRDDWLYLTLPMGESLDLFRIRLRPGDGAVSGEPQRLTFGTGNVKSPRATRDGQIVFARDDITYDLYSLGLSPGKSPAQDLRRHTSETGQSFRPSVHSSGGMGVWEKLRAGFSAQVWFFDLLSGSRLKLGFVEAGDTRICSHALISPDGRWAAYRVAEPGVQPIYRQPVTGGPAKLICDNCGTPSDFTSDGRHIFYITGGRPAIIGILDIASGQHADLIKHPSYDLYGARVRLNSSGDGWVAFYADNGVRTHQIFLAPMRAFQPAPQEKWIAVTDGAHWDQSPVWAPDGRTIYYVSRHDGFACIMARAIDPLSGQPRGTSWAVQHFHSSSQTLMRSMNRRGADALWVAGDRIFFTLDNRSSDLWKISVLGRSN